MPERAAEISQVSDDTREELIAKTAGEWPAANGGVAPPGDLGRAVGDLPGFLAAYYRFVAADEKRRREGHFANSGHDLSQLSAVQVPQVIEVFLGGEHAA